MTFEQLQSVFTGRNFVRGIKKAFDVYSRVGFESQFTFWKGARNNKIKYFPCVSTSYDLPDSTTLEISDNQSDLITEQKLIPLLSYHYHPQGSSVMPSEADVQAHADFIRQYSNISDRNRITFIVNHSLDCIGACREQGQFQDVLVCQNKSFETCPFSEGENVQSQIREKQGGRLEDNTLVAEALDSLNNWNATLLTYERQGNIYTLPKEQLSRLGKFAYTPTTESVITDL